MAYDGINEMENSFMKVFPYLFSKVCEYYHL